jgi:glucosamine--fructose-6-phosphate aminotransferase (isomerizing)
MRQHEPIGQIPSRLGLESAEVPEVIKRQNRVLVRQIADLLTRVRQKSPQLVVTCGRGSSAHAATFGKHLFERYLGIPVSAAAPNVASVYRRSLDLSGQLFLTISQSGRSEDLIATADMARSAGAITAAIVNEVDSPLANACEFVLPMEAGPELSVAATKSFIASLAALLRLTADWRGDLQMKSAVERLADRLAAATELDWSSALPVFSSAASAMTVGRGPTLAIAREAALKLKEVCNIHAEAFSSAEFQHGPISLVDKTYPVLMFLPADAAAAGTGELRLRLSRQGAAVFATGGEADAPGVLPVVEPHQPEADAICLIQTFYRFVLQLAANRGSDVDHPRHLQKVTSTL